MRNYDGTMVQGHNEDLDTTLVFVSHLSYAVLAM